MKLFNVLLGKFPEIKIKYEYSKKLGCFLASIDVCRLVSLALDDFSMLLISLIEELQEKFGVDSPLFSINEDCFSLSSDAISYSIGSSAEYDANFQCIINTDVSLKETTIQSQLIPISISIDASIDYSNAFDYTVIEAKDENVFKGKFQEYSMAA